MMTYDIIIIGAGPAGLTAANNTAHRGLKTLVLEARHDAGGQPMFFYPKKRIIDHPGFPDGITGEDLSKRLFEQAERSGAEIHMDEEVTGMVPRVRFKIIKTSKGDYRGKRIILATGMLNVPRKHPVLEKYKSSGVTHFVRDPEKYRGLDVLVVGGGDAAFDNAVMIAGIAKSVTVIDRGPEIKAKESTVELARKNGVRIMTKTKLAELVTDGKQIQGALLSERSGHKKEEIKVDRIIVSIGFLSSKEFFDSIGLRRYSDGAVVVNEKMETNLEGVFAAGDLTGEVKLIAVACAEGIIAAVNTFNSIRKPYWLNPTHK